MNSLHLSPLQDTERIFALPDRAAREAALLELPAGRQDMVAHFLILKFANAMNRTDAPEALLEGVPAHLREDVMRLARSYASAARTVAAARP